MAYKKVKFAASSNVSSVTTTTPTTIDGVAVVQNDLVLLLNQTNGAQNGIWVCGSPSVPVTGMSRPAAGEQYATSNVLDNNTHIWVTTGNTLAGKVYGLDPAAKVTIDTTSHTYAEIALPTVQVRAATTASITISNPGTSTMDGVTMNAGDLLLVKNQGSQDDGIYIWQGSSSSLIRSPEPLTPNRTVRVSEGTINSHGHFKIVAQGVIKLGTTAPSFANQNTVGNVRDFGAKGDGSTSDDTAINNAAASLSPAGTLLFPSGDYVISSGDLTLPAGVTVEFSEGAKLSPSGRHVTINGRIHAHPT